MSAGITSQYGFLYQRYVFIKLVLDYAGMNRFFVYEGIDDIDVSETERIDSVRVSNDVFYQVKSGNVSQACWAKVLGNFLLNDNDNPTFNVVLEKNLMFDIYDEIVIEDVCDYFVEGESKKASSIANKVYKKFVNGDEDKKSVFKNLINALLPKVSCIVLPFDKLLEQIEESFRSIYCQDILIYDMAKSCRCERFINEIQASINVALEKKTNYALRYQDFVNIVGKVTTEISDQKYTINISEMKKRKRQEAENLMNCGEQREVRQLQLVNPNSGFIVKELVNELLYRDFRSIYSDSKETLISNIEETAHSNFEDTIYSIPDNSEPFKVFANTVDKEIPLSIVDNSPIYRHGCYVFLTSDEIDEDKQITWGDG